MPRLLKIATGFALGVAAAVLLSARRHPATETERTEDAGGAAGA